MRASTRSEFRLAPSCQYRFLSIALHTGAAALLACSRLEPLALAVLLGVVAISLLRDLREQAWRSAPRAIRAIVVDDRGWTLVRRDGSRCGPSRLADVRALQAGVMLCLRAPRARVLVPADALPAERLRELRVRALDALGAQ